MRANRFKVIVACTCVAAYGMIAAGTSAAAVAPSNDTVAGATAVSGVPFRDVVDTTMATTDADDAQLSASDSPYCQNPSAPAMPNSVWYTFTAGNEGWLYLDAGGSSYYVGLRIATGTPGALTSVSCGDVLSGVQTVPGTTYYINAFDEYNTGGGTLDITFAGPPSLTISSVKGTVDRSGTATVTFTYVCSSVYSVLLSGQMSQPVGRVNTITGYGGNSDFGVNCTSGPLSISMTIAPNSGKFAGRPYLSGALTACGPGGCADSSFSQAVVLTGKAR